MQLVNFKFGGSSVEDNLVVNNKKNECIPPGTINLIVLPLKFDVLGTNIY